MAARNFSRPCAITSTLYSPAIGSRSLPWSAVSISMRRKAGGDFLLDELGLALLDHQHGALAAAEIGHLLRHQRVGDVEHQQRNLGGAEGIGQPELLQRADQRIVQAALHDDADVGMAAGQKIR
jgi:hypothetical protein